MCLRFRTKYKLSTKCNAQKLLFIRFCYVTVSNNYSTYYYFCLHVQITNTGCFQWTPLAGQRPPKKNLCSQLVSATLFKSSVRVNCLPILGLWFHWTWSTILPASWVSIDNRWMILCSQFSIAINKEYYFKFTVILIDKIQQRNFLLYSKH